MELLDRSQSMTSNRPSDQLEPTTMNEMIEIKDNIDKGTLNIKLLRVCIYRKNYFCLFIPFCNVFSVKIPFKKNPKQYILTFSKLYLYLFFTLQVLLCITLL